MEINTNNNHMINTLGMDVQAVLRASINSHLWDYIHRNENAHQTLSEALFAPSKCATSLPLELQDSLMDYLFEDEHFEARRVSPEDFDEMIFGARPGDVYNIKLRDILEYQWEPSGNVGSLEALIAEGQPLIIISPSQVYLGSQRGLS